MCDGYAVYQAVARGRPELLLCFCWAHVRRGFVEALPAYPQCEQGAGENRRAVRRGAQATRLRGAGAQGARPRQSGCGPSCDKRSPRRFVEQLEQWAMEQEALPQTQPAQSHLVHAEPVARTDSIRARRALADRQQRDGERACEGWS